MDRNPALQAHDPKISEIISKWMKSGRRGNIFDLVLSETNYRGFSASSWDMTYKPDFIEEFKNANGFPSNMTAFNKFGIGVQSNNQKIEMYFVFVV